LSGSKLSDKTEQISDNDKSQLLQYFINKNISKISLENGKLVIEYKGNTKTTIENEDQQLQEYHQIIEKLPNKSLSLSDLQNSKTNNHSIPDKTNTAIYIGLTIGAFLLTGAFIYFLVRKKKK
jgi:ATP-dependent Zn protease